MASQGFDLLGHDILLRHVLFNLLKNALYFISAAGRGEIELQRHSGKKYNCLHFIPLVKRV